MASCNNFGYKNKILVALCVDCFQSKDLEGARAPTKHFLEYLSKCAMAFVSRSPRNMTLIEEVSTSPRVGPGTYTIPRILDSGRDRINYVPFGSGSGRPIHDYSNDVPAPGSYIEPISWRRPEPASWNAFKSSKPRFPDHTDEHDVQRPIGIEHTPWASQRTPRILKRPPPLQKSPYTSGIPSIPANSFGYIMEADGTLQPRPPPKPKTIPVEETGTLSSRGPIFGRGAERWPEKVAKTTSPGPGEYNPIDLSMMSFDKSKTSRLSSSFAASTHRNENTAPAGPGPGNYDIVEPFRKPTIASKLQNFGSRTSRWVENIDPEDIGPGPGSYNPDRCPQYIRLRPPPVPFNSVSERFPEPVPEKCPGPQDYMLPPSIRVPKSQSNAPFGSRTERFEQRRTQTPPPPSVNNETRQISARTRTHPQPTWKSVVTGSSTKQQRPEARLSGPDRDKVLRRRARRPQPAWKSIARAHPVRRPAAEAPSGPAPGAYDIDSATTAFRSRRYRAKGYQFAPRTERPARRDQIMAPLIQELKNDVVVTERSPSESPRHRKKTVLGTSSFLSHVDRFADDVTVAMHNRNPGPGEYGDLRRNFLKKTFNITIDPDFDRIPNDS